MAIVRAQIDLVVLGVVIYENNEKQLCYSKNNHPAYTLRIQKYIYHVKCNQEIISTALNTASNTYFN